MFHCQIGPSQAYKTNLATMLDYQTFMFKILDFSNEQTMDDTNNRTNVSSFEINSDMNNKVKFLHQQNSRRQNFTINSNFNNNNNNGQVEIVFKLKSILKDIFKFKFLIP